MESPATNLDASYRILRCTSTDAVRRNDQVSSHLLSENLLKQKMSSSKKHHHTSGNVPPSMENSRSHSFSSNVSMLNSSSPNNKSNVRYHQNGEIPLQKPRVYTYEDRPYSSQQAQQHLLSSSSTSSSLSVKEKAMKEMIDSQR